MRKRKIWTEEELDLLRSLYPYHRTQDLEKIFKTTVWPIYNKAHHLGLKKDPDILKVWRKEDGERLQEKGKAYRYPKGNSPFNKGRKMPKEVYEKVKSTMFKKGHSPHNTNYDGHERVSKDGYVEIRIRKGKYRLKHLHRWEQLYGEIPKGHCLVCRDGNKQNTDPGNWELITRAENMRRNTINRFPPELRSTLKTLSKFNKKLKESCQETN